MDLGLGSLEDEAVRLVDEGGGPASVLSISPEVLTEGEPDVRSDLYSLGMVLNEALTGRLHRSPGSEGRGPEPARDTKSSGDSGRVEPSSFLTGLVAALLRRDPRERFASASGLRAVLEVGEASAWWRSGGGAQIPTLRSAGQSSGDDPPEGAA